MAPVLVHGFEVAEGTSPTRWMLFLHGIFGRGLNWRGFARRLVKARPDWGAVLVDLRMHGGSQGFPPPHTVAACAEDLLALEASVPGPIRGVLGHSFGGKVALDYLARRGEVLEQTWLLDSVPGARPDGRGSDLTLQVIDLLARAPQPVARRAEFIEWLAKQGIETSIAQWLAMNLDPGPDGYRLELDLPAIHALLDDYLAVDLWRILESPPGKGRVEVVIGGRSAVFDAADRERVARLAAESSRLQVEVLPNAGHWVHVDDPEGLYLRMTAALS